MRQQFKKYCGKEPQVVTIPVGSLDELKYPDEPRKRHSLITAFVVIQGLRIERSLI